jgi:hypothetical protein
MMRSIALGFATAVVVSATALPAAADGWHDRDRDRGWHEHRGHDRDWRRGAWWHGRHDGRLGWWWTVDGAWYLYPTPVYPYPDPAYAAPPPVYYWCDNPRGYYPAVPACAMPWRIVPAAPSP